MLWNSMRVFELRVFEFLLKYCSQNGICWNMSKNIQHGSLKEDKTIQNTPMEVARPPNGYLAKFCFFEAAISYIFGHFPTNAYAILAAIFQQEFKHPKFKHPNGIPKYGMCTHEMAFMGMIAYTLIPVFLGSRPLQSTAGRN